MLRKIFMRNDLSKERFRNEWKYLISTSEKELLELRMKHLLKKDPNAKGNGYMIRSLYFEDYFNSAYAEKESGVLMRKKYRIRIHCAENFMWNVSAISCVHARSLTMTVYRGSWMRGQSGLHLTVM